MGNTLSKHIGNKIQIARKELNIKQEILSDYLGIGRAALSNIEEGRQNVTNAHLYKLACLFNKPVSFFFPDLLPVTYEIVTETEVVMVEKIIKGSIKTAPGTDTGEK